MPGGVIECYNRVAPGGIRFFKRDFPDKLNRSNGIKEKFFSSLEFIQFIRKYRYNTNIWTGIN
ncbi:MAG TPA: hypothetical protein DCO83_17985 [Mucilaginibacter sp.]|nr:hypothetical protein [Mucilaginibacter sp.]